MIGTLLPFTLTVDTRGAGVGRGVDIWAVISGVELVGLVGGGDAVGNGVVIDAEEVDVDVAGAGVLVVGLIPGVVLVRGVVVAGVVIVGAVGDIASVVVAARPDVVLVGNVVGGGVLVGAAGAVAVDRAVDLLVVGAVVVGALRVRGFCLGLRNVFLAVRLSITVFVEVS